MNILCLGCSFTTDMKIGEPFEFDSWPRQLAKRMPEHTIINAGEGATSVAHSMWIMEQFTKENNLEIKIDKIIFQVTNPGRLTYYTDLDRDLDVSKFLKRRTNNYLTFNLPKECIHPINLGLLGAGAGSDLQWRQDLVSFAKTYYTNIDYYHFERERRAQVEFISKRADFVFFHTSSQYSSLPSIEDVLGEEKFKSYLRDSGKHFNKEGIDWEASYIERMIRTSW